MTADQIIRFVLTHPDMEGGGLIVNDPQDPGGLTRYGFSQRAYPGTDIRNLTLEQAVRMAFRDYWDPAGCAKLPMTIGAALFDFEFNSGPVARKVLQSVLQCTPDGSIGPKTIAAAMIAGADIVPLYLARRAQYCEQLANWKHAKEGWLKRWFTLSQFIGRFV